MSDASSLGTRPSHYFFAFLVDRLDSRDSRLSNSSSVQCHQAGPSATQDADRRRTLATEDSYSFCVELEHALLLLLLSLTAVQVIGMASGVLNLLPGSTTKPALE